MPQRMRQRRGD